MEPSCCFLSIWLQVAHEFNKKARVSIEMTATTPSQADHPRWLHDNNDKDLIQRGLSLNSQRLIKYNIKVKNLNSSEMQIVELN